MPDPHGRDVNCTPEGEVVVPLTQVCKPTHTVPERTPCATCSPRACATMNSEWLCPCGRTLCPSIGSLSPETRHKSSSLRAINAQSYHAGKEHHRGMMLPISVLLGATEILKNSCRPESNFMETVPSTGPSSATRAPSLSKWNFSTSWSGTWREKSLMRHRTKNFSSQNWFCRYDLPYLTFSHGKTR